MAYASLFSERPWQVAVSMGSETWEEPEKPVGTYLFYGLLTGYVCSGSNSNTPHISEMSFVRITEMSQKLKWQASGCARIISGSRHGSSVRGFWKFMQIWESVGRRNKLLLPGSGLRTESRLPFNGHSTRLLCSCCLSRWPPCRYNSCFKRPLCNMFLCSLSKFCKLHHPIIT